MMSLVSYLHGNMIIPVIARMAWLVWNWARLQGYSTLPFVNLWNEQVQEIFAKTPAKEVASFNSKPGMALDLGGGGDCKPTHPDWNGQWVISIGSDWYKQQSL